MGLINSRGPHRLGPVTDGARFISRVQDKEFVFVPEMQNPTCTCVEVNHENPHHKGSSENGYELSQSKMISSDH